jgi:spermidine synthase
VEFFRLCKTRLSQGGVLYFNTTGSKDAIFTVAQVFPHVVEYGGFAAASDVPFNLPVADRRNNLLRFHTPDGTPFFHTTPQRQALLQRLAETSLPDVGDQYRQRRDLRIITDDNMLTEFKL